MAITRISQSTVKEGLEKFNSFLGGYIPAAGDYEYISTISIPNNGLYNYVTFNNISGYRHLQLRGRVRNSRTASSQGSSLFARFNGDAGSNYASFRLLGSGDGNTYASSYLSVTGFYAAESQSNGAPSQFFTNFVVDILDYTSSSKKKVARTITGSSTNTTVDSVALYGSLWNSVSPIYSMTLYDLNYSFISGTTFNLYGVK